MPPFRAAEIIPVERDPGHAGVRRVVIATASPSSVPPPRGRLIVVGAGVIGLGVGYRLARAGWDVDVFDAREAGSGASHAAAGMLAAGAELEPGEEELFRLNRMSQDLWPGFAREIEAYTGLSVGYRDEGTLVVALTRDDVARLRFTAAHQRRHGVVLEWLDGRGLRAREPHVAPGAPGALYSPHDHQVDNRLLAAALKAAFLKAGGRLHERAPVETLRIEKGRVRGVRAGGVEHAAEKVLLAAGAWSRLVPGLADADRPPVRPIKGQMLALAMPSGAPLIRHVVWAPKIYLVPRSNGRLVLGATVEEKGFDPRMTAGGLLALLEAAWRVLPGIEELPILETWSGFRPGSPDDAPVIGEASTPGLTVATGHHRNGVLLCPATVETVARLIATGEADPAIRPFGPGRFAARERHEIETRTGEPS